MQTSFRLLDDLAKVAGGAASGIVGLKAEAETMVRQQLQRLLADANMVSRDEFDAVKAVATKARAEQEKLLARVTELEAKLGIKTPAKAKKAAKAGPKKKTRAAK